MRFKVSLVCAKISLWRVNVNPDDPNVEVGKVQRNAKPLPHHDHDHPLNNPVPVSRPKSKTQNFERSLSSPNSRTPFSNQTRFSVSIFPPHCHRHRHNNNNNKSTFSNLAKDFSSLFLSLAITISTYLGRPKPNYFILRTDFLPFSWKNGKIPTTTMMKI